VEYGISTGAVSLENISEKMALGPRTVQRRLDEHGLNYRKLVTACRMRRARELLSGTEASVKLVSAALGYSMTSHFTRAFSKYQGITPSEFRNGACKP